MRPSYLVLVNSLVSLCPESRGAEPVRDGESHRMRCFVVASGTRVLRRRPGVIGYPARPPRGTLRTRYVSWCSGCDSIPVTVSVVDIVPVTRNARPSLPRFPSSGFPKHPAAWAPCPQPYAVGRDAPPELMVPARIHAVYVTTNQCGVVSRAELPRLRFAKRLLPRPRVLRAHI